VNSTSKPAKNAADTIDNVALIGTAGAVFALKMAVLRIAVVSAVGAYPEPFAGIPGAIWWTCFAAGIGTAAVCYAAAIFMLIRGETP
jgi:hypothetical protein